MKKIKLAVLISGGGSNLQALIDVCQQPDFPAEIAVVISNIADAYGLERAKKAGIAAIAIPHKNYKGRAEFEAAVQSELEKHRVQLVCLAGFMRILTPDFVKGWEGRMLNTHPALLPKHGGEGMHGEHVHRAVLAAGDAESGATIHYVIPEVDRGEIIVQKRVKVLPGDTVETLAARVLEQEHIAYPEAVRIVAEKLRPNYINCLCKSLQSALNYFIWIGLFAINLVLGRWGLEDSEAREPPSFLALFIGITVAGILALMILVLLSLIIG